MGFRHRRDNEPLLRQFTLSYLNGIFQVAAATADLALLFTLRQYEKMLFATAKPSVIFSDGAGAMTDVTLAVGDGGANPAIYLPATSIGETVVVGDAVFADAVPGKSQLMGAAGSPVGLRLASAGRNFGLLAQAVTAVSSANPAEITHAGHGLLTNCRITISAAVAPWAGLNGSWLVTKTAANTFTIPFDATGIAAYAGAAVYNASFLISGSVDLWFATLDLG